MLSAKRLRELVIYSPGNGEFHWRIDRPSGNGAIKAKAGARTGTVNSRGYEIIVIQYKYYLAHRLAWLYMTGSWPIRIDHVDGNPANNRWVNLREASQSLNVARGRTQKNRSAGRKGTWYDRGTGRWQSYISKNKKRIHLGVFKTYPAALAARRAAEVRLFGEYSL